MASSSRSSGSSSGSSGSSVSVGGATGSGSFTAGLAGAGLPAPPVKYSAYRSLNIRRMDSSPICPPGMPLTCMVSESTDCKSRSTTGSDSSSSRLRILPSKSSILCASLLITLKPSMAADPLMVWAERKISSTTLKSSLFSSKESRPSLRVWRCSLASTRKKSTMSERLNPSLIGGYFSRMPKSSSVIISSSSSSRLPNNVRNCAASCAACD